MNLRNLTVVFFLLLVFATALFPIQDGDLFFYLSMGKEFFRNGFLPSQNPFIFTTPATAWQAQHEWLVYVLAYGLFSIGGYGALIVAKALVYVSFFGLTWLFAKKREVSVDAWVLVSAITLVCCFLRFYERASLFTDIATPITFLILLLERENPSKRLWILPFLFLIWGNVHPGFPLGLAILGFAILTNPKERRLWICMGLSLVALLFNPDGIYGLLYPFQFMGGSGYATRAIYEFMPTWDPLFVVKPEIQIFLGSLFVTLVLLLRRGWRVPQFETLVFLFLMALSLKYIRSVSTGALTFLILNLSLLRGAKLNLRNVLAPIFGLLVLHVMVYGYPTSGGWRKMGVGIDGRIFPKSVVEQAKRMPKGTHFFNSYVFGCYLPWITENQIKVIYDCSTNDEFLFYDVYGQIARAKEEFDGVVARYGIRAFVLSRHPGEKPLFDILQTSEKFMQVTYDDTAVLYVDSFYVGPAPK